MWEHSAVSRVGATCGWIWEHSVRDTAHSIYRCTKGETGIHSMRHVHAPCRQMQSHARRSMQPDLLLQCRITDGIVLQRCEAGRGPAHGQREGIGRRQDGLAVALRNG